MTTAEITSSECLQAEIANLQAKLVERDEKVIHLSQENNYLKEQLSWFKRQIFGKRSERIVSDLNEQQLPLRL